jgi:hypothetical protein
MAEHRGEQRQLRPDVTLVAIPAQERAQHKTVAEVVQAGRALERVPIKAGRAAKLIEPPPDEVPGQPSSLAGEKEGGRVIGIGAQLVAPAGVALKRGDRARVKAVSRAICRSLRGGR